MIQKNVNAVNAVHAVVKNAAIKEVKMPKFYRQNKKRIDPRYFLNETTYRDQLNPTQGAMKGDIDSDGDVDPQDVADLAQQVAQSSGTSKEQLMIMISDRISDVGFGKETEEDFDYTKEELCDDDSNLCGDIMGITYKEYQAFKSLSTQKSNRENYNLASSVMQHDDSIPLQKKIPSGYGTRGGKKSGQLEFPGLG